MDNMDGFEGRTCIWITLIQHKLAEKPTPNLTQLTDPWFSHLPIVLLWEHNTNFYIKYLWLNVATRRVIFSFIVIQYCTMFLNAWKKNDKYWLLTQFSFFPLATNTICSWTFKYYYKQKAPYLLHNYDIQNNIMSHKLSECSIKLFTSHKCMWKIHDN